MKQIIFLLLILLTSCVPLEEPQQSLVPTNDKIIVTKIVDGDTIDVEVNGVEQRIRILGIDFPDISKDRIDKWTNMGLSEERIKECYKKGNEFMEGYLLNLEVQLIADPKEKDKDQYGRLLRYVAASKDMNQNMEGIDVESVLLALGYAVEYDPTKPPCYWCARYAEIEENHRDLKQGCLWA